MALLSQPGRIAQTLRNLRKLGFWTGKNAGRFAKNSAEWYTKNLSVAKSVVRNSGRIGAASFGGLTGAMRGTIFGGVAGGLVGAARNVAGNPDSSSWGGMKTGAMIGAGLGGMRGFAKSVKGMRSVAARGRAGVAAAAKASPGEPWYASGRAAEPPLIRPPYAGA